MPISIRCSCGQNLRAKEEQAGQRCKCPGCGKLLTVPPPAESNSKVPPKEKPQSTVANPKPTAPAMRPEPSDDFADEAPPIRSKSGSVGKPGSMPAKNVAKSKAADDLDEHDEPRTESRRHSTPVPRSRFSVLTVILLLLFLGSAGGGVWLYLESEKQQARFADAERLAGTRKDELEQMKTAIQQDQRRLEVAEKKATDLSEKLDQEEQKAADAEQRARASADNADAAAKRQAEAELARKEADMQRQRAEAERVRAQAAEAKAVEQIEELRRQLATLMTKPKDNIAKETPKEGKAGSLIGTWKSVSGEIEGMASPPELIGVQIKITDKHIRVALDAEEATYTVDTTKTPHEIDMTPKEGPKVKGIFKVEGDTLTLCIGVLGDARPTAFATKAGSGAALMVCKREGANTSTRTGDGPIPLQLTYDGQIFAVAYSSDGKWLAVGGSDKVLRLWDAKTLKEVASLGQFRFAVGRIVFSPDSKTLAACGGRKGDVEVFRWDLTGAKPRELPPLAEHRDTVFSVAFTPDGKTAATVCYDSTIWIWDLSGEKPKVVHKHEHLFGGTRVMLSIAFLPDGKSLLVGDNASMLTLWSWDGTKLTQQSEALGNVKGVNHLAVSGDGKMAATGGESDGSVIVWDIVDGKLKERGKAAAHDTFLTAVAIAPDGKTLATTGGDKSVRLWDFGPAEPKQRFALDGHKMQVGAVAFSHDGKTVASGGWDQTVRFWETATGKPILDPNAATTKADPDPKDVAINKEWLLGKWKGKLANGNIEIWLNEQNAVVTFELTGGQITVGNLGPYRIDDKKNEVSFGGAVAKRTKDGALLVSGQITMGLNTFNVPETRIERLAGKEPGPDPKLDPVKKEIEDLQGRWNMSHSVSGGFTVTVQGFSLVLVFEGEKVKEGRVFGPADLKDLDVWNYTVDPSKSPKTIDMKLTGKDGKTTTWLGIYELKGNEFKVMWSKDGKARPAKFDDAIAGIDFYYRLGKKK